MEISMTISIKEEEEEEEGSMTRDDNDGKDAVEGDEGDGRGR